MLEIVQNFKFTDIIIYLIIICICLKSIWEFGEFILDKLNIFHKKKKENELTAEEIEKLKEHDKWQYEKINEISNSISDIKLSLNKIDADAKIRTVATYRTTLFNLHREFTKQGFVTEDGLKTFLEVGKIYEGAGGNDIYHDKLYPEVMALEIR